MKKILLSVFLVIRFLPGCSDGSPVIIGPDPQNNQQNNLNNVPDGGPVDVPEDVVDVEEDIVDPGDRPWWELEGSDSMEPFVFLVVADTHMRLPGLPDDGRYNNQKNVDNLNELVRIVNEELAHAHFLAVSGDVVGALFSLDPEEYFEGAYTPANEFKAVMDNMSIPWQISLGNHDYQENFTWEGITAPNPHDIEAIWKKVVGMDPYYGFVYRGTRFLFLNSVRGDLYWDPCILSSEESGCKGSFDVGQIEWLSEQLSNPEPVFMFFHHPVHTDSWYKVWSAAGGSFMVDPQDDFYLLALEHASKIKAIFVGHGHLWVEDTLNGAIQVYETGPIGDSRADPKNIRKVTVYPQTQEFHVERY